MRLTFLPRVTEIWHLRILEKLEQPVAGAFFVGAPVGEKPLANYERDVAFCGFEFNWDIIKKNAKKFVVFHSDNDPLVCLKNGEVLAKRLGVALDFIPNAGHFNRKAGFTEFPQLLKKIKEQK